MTQKFNVGDKVKAITDNYGFTTKSHGWEGVVTEVSAAEFSAKTTKGRAEDIGDRFSYLRVADFELINAKPTQDKPTKKQRLSELERQVAELQAEVASLKAQPKPTEIAEMFAQAQLKVKQSQKTPNEQRKAIIAEAKAFVKKYSGVVHDDTTPYTTQVGDVEIRLHVNPKKRTVVAIPYLVHVEASISSDKKFAKCAPDDVFNADIGKAIALGRALGLDVERFEQAVKPTEVVAGMVAKCLDNFDEEYTAAVIGGYSFLINSEDCLRRRPDKLVAILDDTNAEY